MTMIRNQKKRRNLCMIILFDLLIILSLILYFGIFREKSSINIHGTYLKNPLEISEFHFIDNHGKPFSKKNLAGNWTMLFFGFTHCAMICPTTMAQLNAMYQILQRNIPENQLPEIVFISVDPKRDSVEKIHSFVNAFNPHFKGIRADMAETVRLEKALHIVVTNTDTINHSMEILLMNPQAQVQAYFSFPPKAEQLAMDYQSILKMMN